MKFNLRPYQVETLNLLRDEIKKGVKRPIICLPTGAGKTVTFSHLAEAVIQKGGSVLVVCHRKELVEQARKTMEAYGVDLLKVRFGMVQTFVRSPHKIPAHTVCIIDECHIANFRRFMDLLPDYVTIVGATATPKSANKKHPLRKDFGGVVCPVQIKELVDNQYLAKPFHKMAKIDESKLVVGSDGDFTTASLENTYEGLFDNIEDAYRQKIGKTIIFTSSIKSSIKVAQRLNALCVHSNMSEQERDLIVSTFKNTHNSTIVNCGILTAGFDDPEIETVIIFRATTSLSLWLQMCGRGSRVIPNVKDTFTIIDMGNNIKRHGLWHLERDWKYIFENEGKNLKEKSAPYKNCCNKECECLIPANASICEFCGAEQPKGKPKEKQSATEFELIAYETGQLPLYLRKPWSEMTVHELIDRAKIGNIKSRLPYKSGWILNQIYQRPKHEAEKMLRQFAILKGYSKGWIFHKTKNL